MARKIELQWHKATKRWRKKINGKDYYFAFGSGKTDLDGYRQALEAYRVKLAELEGETAAPIPSTLPFSIPQIAGELNQADFFGLTSKDLLGLSTEEIISAVKSRAAAGLLGGLVPTFAPAKSPETNLGAYRDQFIGLKKIEATAGSISIGRWGNLRQNLTHFVEFAGVDSDPKAINGLLLTGYRSKIIEEMGVKKYSAAHGSDLIRSAKQFVRWLWENEVLANLPRNLLKLSIERPTKEITTFADDEIAALFAKSNEITRLHLLLMLNCGMNQKDIADLKQCEIDWKQGRIIRKRSKTKNESTTPTVNYKLWDDTFALLRKYNSGVDPVLQNNRGNALTGTVLNEKGNLKKFDAIGDNFRRLARAIGISKSPKIFRKTSATKITSKYPHFKNLFLAHAAAGVADKHYAGVVAEQFDEAVNWLGTQIKR